MLSHIFKFKSGYSPLRLTFITYNVLLLILGIVSLLIGLWLYTEKHDYEALTPAHHGAASATGLCIAAGAAIIVIAFVGCSAASIESRCLLLTYVVFISIICCVELTAGILGSVYKGDISSALRTELLIHMNSPYISESTRITWDRLQQDFTCCGVDTYSDWFKNIHWAGENWVPDACCIKYELKCGRQEPENFYQEGCLNAFRDWLLEHVHIVGMMGIIMALYQAIGILLAITLYCFMRHRSQPISNTYVYHKAECSHDDDVHQQH